MDNLCETVKDNETPRPQARSGYPDYPAYDRYKDSGVDWIGKIPQHWDLLNYRYLINVLTDYTANGSFADLAKNVQYKDEKDYSRLVRLTDLRNNLKNFGVFVSESAHEYLAKSSLFGGELLMANVGAYAGYVCIMPKIDMPATLAPNMFLLKHKSNVLIKFLEFLINSSSYWNFLKTAAQSSAQPKLNKDNVRALRIVLPPIEEQKAIACFLDEKTQKIDKAVKIKEAQIALLKERKQILIQEAVTKGLNLNAPMKDSGIDWIGHIPQHWEVKRLRDIFSFSKGLTITKENLRDTGIPCVNYGEIHSKYGFSVNPKLHRLKCVDSTYLETSKKSLLEKGNFIFADTSEDLEGSGNFTFLDSNTPTFAGYHTIIGRIILQIIPRYLAYVLDSESGRNQTRAKVKGVKVFSITNNLLKSNSAWLPPLEEQKAIVEHIDKESAKIDTAIAVKNDQITALKDYKTTLINAAVTGKINVTSYANHPQNERSNTEFSYG